MGARRRRAFAAFARDRVKVLINCRWPSFSGISIPTCTLTAAAGLIAAKHAVGARAEALSGSVGPVSNFGSLCFFLSFLFWFCGVSSFFLPEFGFNASSAVPLCVTLRWLRKQFPLRSTFLGRLAGQDVISSCVVQLFELSSAETAHTAP